MKFGFGFFAKHEKNCQTLKILGPFSFDGFSTFGTEKFSPITRFRDRI